MPVQTNPGVYNLLCFSEGKYTLLADAAIFPGTLSHIRLILGAGNFSVTKGGQKISLKTFSVQEDKGLVALVVAGGIIYRIT